MKSTGMTLTPEVRSVCFRGFSVALILLSTCSCSALDVITVINGTDGEAVSLPCKCPPVRPPYLVWQKVNGEDPLVVNYYKDNDQEDKLTAPEFRNRTELKLRGNCSLVFHRVSLSDRGLYECYYMESPLRSEKIQLVIREKQTQPPSQNVQSNIVTSSVCVFLIVITIAAVYLGITCRKRHQMRRAFTATSRSSI